MNRDTQCLIKEETYRIDHSLNVLTECITMQWALIMPTDGRPLLDFVKFTDTIDDVCCINIGRISRAISLLAGYHIWQII